MSSSSETIQQFLAQYHDKDLDAIKESAESGDSESQFRLGVLYMMGKGVESDILQASAWFDKAADQEYFAAITLRGRIFSEERQDPRAGPQAVDAYMRAAELGDTDAQCALADLFLDGRPGVEKNVPSMLHWYQKAAHAGHPKAQFQLGKLLAEGVAVQQSDEGAFRWFTLAILSGSELAKKELEMLTARLSQETIQSFQENMSSEFNPQ